MENLKEQYSSEDSTTLAGRGGSHLWRKLVEVYFNTSDMGKQKSSTQILLNWFTLVLTPLVVRLDHVFILNLFKITSPTTLEPLSGNKPYTYLKRGQAWDDNDLTSFEHSNTVIVVEIKVSAYPTLSKSLIGDTLRIVAVSYLMLLLALLRRDWQLDPLRRDFQTRKLQHELNYSKQCATYFTIKQDSSVSPTI